MNLLPLHWTRPIRVEFRPALSSVGRKLVWGTGNGTPVHGGADIRRRRLIIDEGLLARPTELRRILVHELFHFVWVRLGNPARRSFERVIVAELRQRAAGELGWSAESRKLVVTRSDMRSRSRSWREYVCESFCDTAAWLYGSVKWHDEFTLAHRARHVRRHWFRKACPGGGFPV